MSDPVSAMPAPSSRSRRYRTFMMIAAGLSAFSAYFSMYAFRKAFAAGSYGGVEGWTALLDFKTAAVIAQVAGYALSKAAGVTFIAELSSRRRGLLILVLISASWVALVAFACLPPSWKIVAMVLNGFPLGMIWGLIFSYLEGRRESEFLGAVLCASFIVASGAVKSTAMWLITAMKIPEFWAPACTGLLYAPLLVASVVILSRTPPPNEEDVRDRTLRKPMMRADRQAFLSAFGPGLLLLILAYVIFTALRDFRDNFATELWLELGEGGSASIFTLSELPVAIVTLTALAGLMTIRDNVRALLLIHGVCAMGALLIGLSTFAYQAGLISGLSWMITTGAGLYLAYTPFNAMLFDRLIAAARWSGTAGFLIYLADASGYAGTVSLLIWKSLAEKNLDWLNFYSGLSYFGSGAGLILMSVSMLFFVRRLGAMRSQTGD
jgi:hypothetical protein